MRTLPLYHWFATSPGHVPFGLLDMKPQSLTLEMKKIHDLKLFSRIKKR